MSMRDSATAGSLSKAMSIIMAVLARGVYE